MGQHPPSSHQPVHQGLHGRELFRQGLSDLGGDALCACSLARVGADPSEARTARQKKILRAIRETAEKLGNTPAICRTSYISPSVLHGFEKGRVIDRYFETVEELVTRRSPGLHRSERALLRLLRQKAS